MSGPSAVVLLDKPEGPTSHDVVALVRRAFGLRRVGHTGTLDPFASGLLLACVGAATRLVEYFHLLPKTYEAEIRFGEATDTDDRTGDVIARGDVGPELTTAALEAALAGSLGRTDQVPPDYSARRKDGRRAYDAARQGAPLALEPRPIEVTEARLLAWAVPTARVLYTVSTGTYVRALARDLGEGLGCPAHLSGLRRTRIGPFEVEAADAPEACGPGRPATLPPAAALAWLPARELSADEAAAIGHGQPIEAGELRPPRIAVDGLAPDDLPLVLLRDGELVAVARRDEGRVAPEKVFRAG